jgi:hypothetical protein
MPINKHDLLLETCFSENLFITSDVLTEIISIIKTFLILQHMLSTYSQRVLIYIKMLCCPQNVCVGSWDLKGRWVSIPSPMESTMIPASWEGGGRRRCKSAFLHLEEKIQGLICHRADEQNALKIAPPHSPIRGKQNSSSKRAHNSIANEKNPPNPYPNQELKCP